MFDLYKKKNKNIALWSRSSIIVIIIIIIINVDKNNNIWLIVT